MLSPRIATRRGALLSLTIAGALLGCDSARQWTFHDLVEREYDIAPLPRDAQPSGDMVFDDAADPPREPLRFEPSGPLELSIEQAVLLALSRNRDLQVQQMTPTIVGTFEEIERAVFDPEVFAEYGIGLDRAEQVSRATGERFSVEGQDNFATIGLRQILPTGTELELGLTHQRTFSDRTPNQHAVRAGASITQALLRGFGPEVNLANIRLAQLDTIASEYELRGFAELLVAEVEQSVWAYVLAQREIEIFEAAHQLAQRQLRETEERIEVGVLPESERAAAKVEVALREQELIDARSDVQQIKLRLLRLLNPDGPAPLARELRVTVEPGETALVLDPVDDHLTVAMRYRPELREAMLRVDQGRLEVLQTRNGLLPRLDLFIVLGKSGFSDSFSGAVRDIDGKGYDFSAGVRLEQALGTRAADARYRGALARRQQAARSVENLAQLIEQDVRSAYLEVERLASQIRATRTTRELQEEAARAEVEKFRVGKSTALLVAQAQRDLLDRQIAEVRSRINYRMALVELYRLEGSLLERRALRVPRVARAASLD